MTGRRTVDPEVTEALNALVRTVQDIRALTLEVITTSDELFGWLAPLHRPDNDADGTALNAATPWADHCAGSWKQARWKLDVCLYRLDQAAEGLNESGETS